jgi:bacterioferritin
LIIEELTRYKFSLEENGPKLLEELQRYYHQDEEDAIPGIEGFPKGEGPRKVDYIRYENPYEAYLNAQIQVVDALIPILEQHIAFLEDDEDIDLVLESFEHSVYRVKKQTYTDVEDWEQLLEHLPEDRLDEIINNPKGHGDLLIKELIWIRSYEHKWMKK